jgi:serine/threonine-protein kinase ATR
MAGFQVESACMVGAWDEVQLLVNRPSSTQDAPLVMARLLLAMQTRNTDDIDTSLSIARTVLGAPITASGVNGYRRSYDAVLDLHLTHELEVIYQAMSSLPASQSRRRNELLRVSTLLSARLDATLPTFRTREPVLSMRRTAFGLL